jgi:hypothetical protein
MSKTDVVIDVIARDRASREFKKVGDSADKAQSKMGRASKVLGGAAKAGALGLAAGAGIAAVGMVKLTKGAIEDEAAQKRLAKTLKNAAGARKSDIKSVENWISKQGVALGVTDDELRPALDRLTVATGDVGKAQKLASLGMDVSAGTGKSLQQVTEALAKAQNGQVGGLSRLGIATKDANGKTKTFAAIQEEMQKKFGGQAKTAANTLEGKMGRLKLVMDETGETIGSKLIPVVTTMATWFLNKGIPAISATYKWLKEKLGPVFGFVGRTVSGLVSHFQNAGDGTSKFRERLGTVVGAVMRVVKTVASNLRPVLTAIGSVLRDQFGPVIAQVAAKFREWQPTIQKVLVIGGKLLGWVFRVGSAILGKVLPPIIKFAGFLVATLVKALVRVIDNTIRFVRWLIELPKKVQHAWDKVKKFGAFLRDSFVGVLRKVGSLGKTLGDKVWHGIRQIGKTLAGLGGWVWGKWKQGNQRLYGHLIDLGAAAGRRVWTGITRIGKTLAGFGTWAWGKFSGKLGWLKDKFASLGRGLTSGMVNGMRNVWDKIKALTKKPLNGIITLAIRPFISAVNKVIPGKGPLTQIDTFASGGAVHGPGSGRSDSIMARLSNGEHVLTADEVRAAGGHGVIYRMRELLAHGRIARGAREGDLGLSRAKNGAHLGFASGGGLDPSRIAAAKRFAKAQAGKPYIWGGVGPGGYDCSGFMSAITNVLRGRSPYSRVGTSASFPWPGFKSGPGQFTVGAFTGNPGHVAGTLDGMNVESTNGSVRVGSAARGASHSMFTRRAHLGAGGAGFLSSLWGKFTDGLAWFKDKIGKLVPKVHGGGLFTTSVMRALAKHILEAMKKHVPGLATGGVVKSRPGGTLIRAGEGGLDEAVIPIARGRGGGSTGQVVRELRELRDAFENTSIHIHLEGKTIEYSLHQLSKKKGPLDFKARA